MILAMVAEGEGWTILTPLALHHAARFQAAVEVLPLPMDPISRTLSLSARGGGVAGYAADCPAAARVDSGSGGGADVAADALGRGGAEGAL